MSINIFQKVICFLVTEAYILIVRVYLHHSDLESVQNFVHCFLLLETSANVLDLILGLDVQKPNHYAHNDHGREAHGKHGAWIVFNHASHSFAFFVCENFDQTVSANGDLKRHQEESNAPGSEADP